MANKQLWNSTRSCRSPVETLRQLTAIVPLSALSPSISGSFLQILLTQVVLVSVLINLFLTNLLPSHSSVDRHFVPHYHQSLVLVKPLSSRNLDMISHFGLRLD